MVVQIIFCIVFYPVLALLYGTFQRESNAVNGCAFGVSMDKDWLDLPQMQGIRKVYSKQLKRNVLMLAVVPAITFFIPYFSIAYTVWMLWLLAVICVPALPFIRANKRTRAVKLALDPEAEMAEDDCWIFGMFYRNPKDERSFVTKRVGIGVTTNMATPKGKFLNVISVLAILVIPIFCAWMILEEFIPIHLAISEQELVAKHIVRDCEIPVDNIEDISLVHTLPKWSKSTGTAMDGLEKGTFYIRNEGKCRVFLNPKNSIFMKFTVKGTTYYVGGYDNEETVRVYQRIRGMT